MLLGIPTTEATPNAENTKPMAAALLFSGIKSEIIESIKAIIAPLKAPLIALAIKKVQ